MTAGPASALRRCRLIRRRLDAGLFLRQFAVLALVLAQLALSFHLPEHLGDGASRAPDCAVCAVAAAGAEPSSEIIVAAPQSDFLEPHLAIEAVPAEASANFHSRAPPLSRSV